MMFKMPQRGVSTKDGGRKFAVELVDAAAR